MIDRLPQKEIEPFHSSGADRELMVLADVVAVLVDWQSVHAVQRRDVLVIGNARNAVSKALVPADHFLVWLFAVGEAAPRAAVRVQVRTLPDPVSACVRVEDVRSREDRGRGEAI